jgi:hypothetical protein
MWGVHLELHYAPAHSISNQGKVTKSKTEPNLEPHLSFLIGLQLASDFRVSSAWPFSLMDFASDLNDDVRWDIFCHLTLG